jgi:hypothetical protein
VISLLSALLTITGFNKLSFVYNDFSDVALLSVLILVIAGLDASYKPDPVSLAEILLDECGRLSPGDAADEISLSLAVCILEAAVYCHCEVAELGLVRSHLNFGVFGKSSYQHYFVHLS